jgi:hypothetical protein
MWIGDFQHVENSILCRSLSKARNKCFDKPDLCLTDEPEATKLNYDITRRLLVATGIEIGLEVSVRNY